MPNDQSRNAPVPPTDDGRPSARTRADVAPVAIETLQQQADRLGVLDPLDVEPAHVYFPEEPTS